MCPLRLILAAPLTDVVMFTLFLRLWSIFFTIATRILLSVFPSPQHYCVYRYARRFITYSDVAVSLMTATHTHTHVSRDLSLEEQNSLWRLMMLLLAWRTPDAVTSHDEDQPWIAGSNRDGIDNDLRAICSTSDRRPTRATVRPSVRPSVTWRINVSTVNNIRLPRHIMFILPRARGTALRRCDRQTIAVM